MSFQSCIKVPTSKQCVSPEKIPSNGMPKESPSGTYNELVSIANEVFGQGNWSHAITSQTVDFVEFVMGKYQIGCAAFVRVQLADGTFHEELGYSNAEASTKGSAIYSARVSSITSALKKALLCFGGVIEDKISKIVGKKSKLKNPTLTNSNKDDNKDGDNKDKDKETTTTAYGVKRSNVLAELSDAPVINGDADEMTSEPPAKRQNFETKQQPVNDKPKSTADPAAVTTFTKRLITSSNINETAKSTVEPVQTKTTAKTEEELRMERKRRQKQKQEEFQRMMREQGLKLEEKTSNKF